MAEIKYDRVAAGAGEVVTLEQFIIEQERCLPHRRGAFSRVIRDIGLAAKIVNREINKAGLVDIIGEAGSINVQGEAQQKLDVMAHDELVQALQRGGVCCLIGSEEQEGIIVPNPVNGVRGDYAVLFDPLDGSSNIDVNVSVGTIFSIYRVPDSVTEPGLEDALRPGVEQVAAGYIVYGSSTMFVYTTGNGVNGFTLEPSIGEFFLSHPDIRIPEQGYIYSINEGYYHAFEPGLKKYIKWMQTPDPATKRPYTTRYIGSYISDFHRNLLKGGIYMYPATAKNPEGKLRLLYEVNPTAFIVEQAGGLATDGHQRVLEKKPASLHERVPLFIGSKAMVERAQDFLAKG